jgi:hypothetical protein
MARLCQGPQDPGHLEVSMESRQRGRGSEEKQMKMRPKI